MASKSGRFNCLIKEGSQSPVTSAYTKAKTTLLKLDENFNDKNVKNFEISKQCQTQLDEKYVDNLTEDNVKNKDKTIKKLYKYLRPSRNIKNKLVSPMDNCINYKADSMTVPSKKFERHMSANINEYESNDNIIFCDNEDISYKPSFKSNVGKSFIDDSNHKLDDSKLQSSTFNFSKLNSIKNVEQWLKYQNSNEKTIHDHRRQLRKNIARKREATLISSSSDNESPTFSRRSRSSTMRRHGNHSKYRSRENARMDNLNEIDKISTCSANLVRSVSEIYLDGYFKESHNKQRHFECNKENIFNHDSLHPKSLKKSLNDFRRYVLFKNATNRHYQDNESDFLEPLDIDFKNKIINNSHATNNINVSNQIDGSLLQFVVGMIESLEVRNIDDTTGFSTTIGSVKQQPNEKTEAIYNASPHEPNINSYFLQKHRSTSTPGHRTNSYREKVNFHKRSNLSIEKTLKVDKLNYLLNTTQPLNDNVDCLDHFAITFMTNGLKLERKNQTLIYDSSNNDPTQIICEIKKSIFDSNHDFQNNFKILEHIINLQYCNILKLKNEIELLKNNREDQPIKTIKPNYK